jgi:hypothetical protein
MLAVSSFRLASSNSTRASVKENLLSSNPSRKAPMTLV